MRTRSPAVVYCRPFVGRPDAFAKSVSFAPISFAFLFMSGTNSCSEPEIASERATAEALMDFMRARWRRSETVISSSARILGLMDRTLAAFLLIFTFFSGSRLSRATMAVMSLTVLAGASRAPGCFAKSTDPASSMTMAAFAEIAFWDRAEAGSVVIREMIAIATRRRMRFISSPMLNVMRLSSCDKQRKTGVNTLAPALSSALIGRESDARPLCIFIFITLLFSYVKKNHIGRHIFRRLSTIFPMEAFGNDRQGRQGSTKPNSLSRDDASRVIDSRREHATIKVKLRGMFDLGFPFE